MNKLSARLSVTMGVVPRQVLAGLLVSILSVGIAFGQGTSVPPSITAQSLLGPGLQLSGASSLSTSNPLNSVAASTYAITTANAAQLILFNNAAGVAVSLPAASATGYTAGFSFGVQNEGVGDVVFTPASGTINGVSALTVPQNAGCEINSDGANWRVAPSCTAVLPGAFGAGMTQLTGDVTAGPGGGTQAAIVVKIGGVTPGTAIAANSGTSGHNLPFLDGTNTWSGAQTYSALQTYSAGIQINNGTAAAPSLFATAGVGIRFNSGFVGFPVFGVDKACTHANGFLVGLCGTAQAVNGGFVPQFEAVGIATHVEQNAVASVAFPGSSANNSISAGFICARSASPTVNTHVAVTTGLALCHNYAEGSDGTAFFIATDIDSDVDGTVSTGAVPGRQIFKTANAAGTLTEWMRGDAKQHRSFKTGASPVPSACGTAPAIDANASDSTGTVTVGASAASCTITFANAYVTYNHCRVSAQATLAAFAYSYTKTAITVTATTLGAAVLDYECDGQ